MPVLRCPPVWEWFMLFTGIIVGVSAFQRDRWVGVQVALATVAVYTLGALNGRRLAQFESSMGNEQRSSN